LSDGVGVPINSQTIGGSQFLNVTLASSGTNGSAVPIRSIQVAGTDGTNLRTLSTDTSGKLNVNTTPGSATPDFSVAGALSSSGANVMLAVSALGSAILEVQGTWVGTIVVQGSNDGGATWNNRSIIVSGLLTSSGVTINGYYRVVGVGAYKLLQVLMSAYTSGTANVILNASVGTDVVGVVNTNPANLQVTATPSTLPTTPAFGQAVVATTSIAVQLSSNVLTQGVVVTANVNNTNPIVVGLSSVTNVTNGTGNGFVLVPGASTGIAVLNTSTLWINGTAGDNVSFVGS
jgi:hypothetical protein